MDSKRTEDEKRVRRHVSGRPSALTMITAAVASAASFFVITKSGIAGTLMGAAVFSAVYSGASHWLGEAVERGASWWLARRGVRVADCAPEIEDPEDLPASSTEGMVLRSPRSLRARRILATWAPLVLAVAAVAASGYSMATGTPIERVIIRERVVEKPVVEERVVVQRETVTVTVPVPTYRDPVSSSGATPSATTTTSPAVPQSTTTTTLAGGGVASSTTTVTVPPPSTTTTTVPPTG